MKELSLLQLSYFKQITLGSDICELQSQNGDRWMLLKVQNHISRKKLQNVKHFDYSYLLFHRHEDSDGFHAQTEFADLLDLVLEIINHDDHKLKHRGKTFFDEVLEMYS